MVLKNILKKHNGLLLRDLTIQIKCVNNKSDGLKN